MTENVWLDRELIWAADREGAELGAPIRLVVGECALCGRTSFPARGSCTWCGASTEPRPVSMQGQLIALTAVLHQTPNSQLDVPYPVALVRFDDVGLDILGTVVGQVDLESLPPGTVVTVVATAVKDGRMHYGYHATPSSDRPY